MNTKLFIIILAASFGLMILSSVMGGILDSSGMVTGETLGSKGITAILILYFALYCTAAFALVPLVTKSFHYYAN